MADINVAPGILQAPANLYQQILANQGTQANTAYTQQQAQGQALTNQRTAFQNQFLAQLAAKAQQAMQTAPQELQAQNQSGDEAPVSNGSVDAAAIKSQLDARLQQRQYIPSQQAAGASMAATAAGMPEIGASIIANEKAGFDRVQQARNVEANKWLTDSYRLQDAVKGGIGITALRDMDRPAADSLEAKGKALGWSDKDLNDHVGEWANAVGTAAFRHTGREISDNNGTPYDKQAGRPVPGGMKGPLSSAQLAEKYAEATKPIVYGAGLPIEPYKHLGFSNPYDYINAEVAAANGGPPLQAPGAPNAAPQAPAAPAKTKPAPQAPAAPAASNAAPAVAGVKPEAFSDPQFARKPIPTPTDQVSLQGAQEQQRLNVSNDNAFLAKVNANAGIANITKPYLDLARKYIEGGGVISGLGSEQALEFSKLAAKAGIPTSWLGDPSKTEEVIKNLMQASLQGARASFGANMSTNEVNLSMTKLNPNVHQQPEAMLSLIKESQAQAQYDQDTARLAPQYLSHGNDPLRFEDWQHQNHDRSQFVQKQTGREATQTVGGVSYYKKDGKWYKENG